MITDSFDNTSEPIVTPEHFEGQRRFICDICIITFSHLILSELKNRFELKECAVLRAANGDRPIYTFEHNGKTVAVCLSAIGAAMAGTEVIEINWLIGAKKYIMFGSAGSLNSAATSGKFVIPSEAYRDEGMSYHYAPPADYIRIQKSEKVEQIFKELDLPYVKGRVWTTDAFYRETKAQTAARQSEGCLAVEMELAGVQAVCDFHGFELYDFLATGDVLDASEYDNSGLHDANHNVNKLEIALEIANRI